jgi:hypothetical protein
MRGLTFNLSCDYAYITDPPIFADIGSSYILLNDGSALLNWKTTFINESISLDVTEMKTSIEEFKIDFDGLSDMSIIFSEKINGIANSIGGKIL